MNGGIANVWIISLGGQIEESFKFTDLLFVLMCDYFKVYVWYLSVGGLGGISIMG